MAVLEKGPHDEPLKYLSHISLQSAEAGLRHAAQRDVHRGKHALGLHTLELIILSTLPGR